MPDRTKATSRTGHFPKYEDEPSPIQEPNPPDSLPEVPDELGSTTGIMPRYQEPADEDDSAERDEDMPAQ